MNHIGLSGYSSGYNPLVFGQSGCSFNVYVCMCVDIHSKRARGPCIHSKRARGQFIHPLSLNVPAGKVGVHSFQTRPRARLRARGRVRGHHPFTPNAPTDAGACVGTIRSRPRAPSVHSKRARGRVYAPASVCRGIILILTEKTRGVSGSVSLVRLHFCWICLLHPSHHARFSFAQYSKQTVPFIPHSIYTAPGVPVLEHGLLHRA